MQLDGVGLCSSTEGSVQLRRGVGAAQPRGQCISSGGSVQRNRGVSASPQGQKWRELETALTSRHPRLRRRPALTSKHTSECNPAADPSMSKKSVKDTTRSTHDAGALPFAAINARARRHRPPQQLGPVCGCSTPLNCTLVTVFYSASLKVANGEAAMHGRCVLGCQTRVDPSASPRVGGLDFATPVAFPTDPPSL